MNVPTKTKRLVREILRARVNPKLEPGDIIGPFAIATAQEWIQWTFKGSPTNDRWCAAVIQKEAAMRGIIAGASDAFYGPQTDDAADRIYRQIHNLAAPIRKDEAAELSPHAQASTIRCWNPTTSQLRAHYGREGENQALVTSPYPLRLDWDLDEVITRFSAHESLTTRFESAMAEILAHYGLQTLRALGLDRFGGCLNVRLKRGGSTPSTHSWGIAADWYPSKNQLKQTKLSALFARADYIAFLNIWEKYGFMSLGRCFDFDWMHQQANP
jgi:hypothetical protein